MNKEQINQIIGNNIRNIRKTKGITLEKLSEYIDISPQMLGSIERGKKGITIYNLFKISKTFNIDISNLFSNHYEIKNINKNNNHNHELDRLTFYLNNLNKIEIQFLNTLIPNLTTFRKNNLTITNNKIQNLKNLKIKNKNNSINSVNSNNKETFYNNILNYKNHYIA